ncbi:septum formation initiator family protein [Paenibacillus sp. SC116]|nr:septum formation initiator family protein [Paenibacillus sp. SC116]MCR8846632.1 septum formation initiator family protein [Paenibacillus sp. SC116]
MRDYRKDNKSSRSTPRMTSNRSNTGAPSGVHKTVKRRLQLWLLFMVVFLGWAGYTYVSQVFQLEDMQKEYAQNEVEKKKAEQIRNDLQHEVNRLDDPEYLLDIARSKGMTLPDERLIRTEEE